MKSLLQAKLGPGMSDFQVGQTLRVLLYLVTDN
jgi:hypothetical protein